MRAVKSKKDNLLLTLSIVMVALSAVLLLSAVGVFGQGPLMSPDPEEGTATVEIGGAASIIFTIDSINWGSGSVSVGESAVLDTEGTTSGSSGFSKVNDGFLIENDGNVPLELSLYVDQALDTWLDPGSGAGVALDIALTNCFGGSCGAGTGGAGVADTAAACTAGGGYVLGTYIPVSEQTTGPGDLFCSSLSEISTADEVEVDLRLTIPSETSPTSGARQINLIADVVQA